MPPRALTRLSAAVAVIATLTFAAPVHATEPASSDRRISGHLTQAGAPVAGAGVSVFGSGRVRVGSTTTDAAGAYEFTGLEPDHYRLEFTLSDGRVQWAYQKDDYYSADAVDLWSVTAAVVDEEVIPLPPSGSLAVTATDSTTGAPVSSFCVEASSPDAWKSGCTDNGRVLLTDAPAGEYQVNLFRLDGHLFPPHQTATVVVDQTTELSFSLTREATVSTVMTDAATGAPVPYACIKPVSPDDPGMATVSGVCADQNGRVTITHMSAGTYIFYATPRYTDHGAQWVGKSGGVGDRGQAHRITVAAGQSATLSPVRLDKAGIISGVVTDAATGKPIADICAYPFAWSSVQGPNPGSFCTNAEGRYTLGGLGPYAWPVEFTDFSGTYAWQWSGGANNRLDAEKVRVHAGRTVAADARLTSGGRITGRITTPAGVYATAFVVNAASGDEAGPYGPPAEDGSYVIGGLATQALKVMFRAGYPADVRWYRDATSFETATVVPVRSGTTVTGIDVRY